MHAPDPTDPLIPTLRLDPDTIRAELAPWDGRATGLGLRFYRGGPWEAVEEIGFEARRDGDSSSGAG